MPDPIITRPVLEPELRRLRRRSRRLRHRGGAAITLVVALDSLLALALADACLPPLPQFVRWALVLGWLTLVVTVAAGCWWRPLRQAPDPKSPDLRTEKDGRRLRRWLAPALLILGGWIALFILAPDWSTRHLVRVLLPSSRFGTAPGFFKVTPGAAELIEGDPFRVSVSTEAGVLADPPEITLYLSDGGKLTEPLCGEAGTYHYQLDKAGSSFDYEIRAGRRTSDRFRVTVWPRPQLDDASLQLGYPTYSALPHRPD